MENMSQKTNKRQGFTLIEILVVIGIIAILATIVIIAINPARQFAQARNTQRVSNVNAILNAIDQNIADNKGVFTCDAAPYPLADTTTTIAVSSTNANIYNCIVPTYMPSMVCDPKFGSNCDDNNKYNTDYQLVAATSGRVTISAQDAEIQSPISVTR